MNNRVVSSLLVLLTISELVSAGNRPGSAGGCSGEGPLGLGPRRRPPRSPGPTSGPTPGPTPGPDNVPGGPGLRRRFLKQVVAPATKRALQVNEEDIEICCLGNGDFGFLMRDLDIGGLSVATEAQGYREIPGDSRWSCRKACRDPANGFDLQSCYQACDCKQNCPTSIDYLTEKCRSECTSTDPLEREICIEDCEQECSERCTGTFNDYIVPLDIYREGLEILDCFYGDLIGDAQGSCETGQAFWESTGYTCQVTEGNNFDCVCDIPGTCLNEVYPCDFQDICANEAAIETPSTNPPTPAMSSSGKSTKRSSTSSTTSSTSSTSSRRRQ